MASAMLVPQPISDDNTIKIKLEQLIAGKATVRNGPRRPLASGSKALEDVDVPEWEAQPAVQLDEAVSHKERVLCTINAILDGNFCGLPACDAEELSKRSKFFPPMHDADSFIKLFVRVFDKFGNVTTEVPDGLRGKFKESGFLSASEMALLYGNPRVVELGGQGRSNYSSVDELGNNLPFAFVLSKSFGSATAPITVAIFIVRGPDGELLVVCRPRASDDDDTPDREFERANNLLLPDGFEIMVTCFVRFLGDGFHRNVGTVDSSAIDEAPHDTVVLVETEKKKLVAFSFERQEFAFGSKIGRLLHEGGANIVELVSKLCGDLGAASPRRKTTRAKSSTQPFDKLVTALMIKVLGKSNVTSEIVDTVVAKLAAMSKTDLLLIAQNVGVGAAEMKHYPDSSSFEMSIMNGQFPKHAFESVFVADSWKDEHAFIVRRLFEVVLSVAKCNKSSGWVLTETDDGKHAVHHASAPDEQITGLSVTFDNADTLVVSAIRFGEPLRIGLTHDLNENVRATSLPELALTNAFAKNPAMMRNIHRFASGGPLAAGVPAPTWTASIISAVLGFALGCVRGANIVAYVMPDDRTKEVYAFPSDVMAFLTDLLGSPIKGVRTSKLIRQLATMISPHSDGRSRFNEPINPPSRSLGIVKECQNDVQSSLVIAAYIQAVAASGVEEDFDGDNDDLLERIIALMGDVRCNIGQCNLKLPGLSGAIFTVMFRSTCSTPAALELRRLNAWQTERVKIAWLIKNAIGKNVGANTVAGKPGNWRTIISNLTTMFETVVSQGLIEVSPTQMKACAHILLNSFLAELLLVANKTPEEEARHAVALQCLKVGPAFTEFATVETLVEAMCRTVKTGQKRRQSFSSPGAMRQRSEQGALSQQEVSSSDDDDSDGT